MIFNKIWTLLEQLKNNWPGLARETEDICEYLGSAVIHAEGGG